MPTGRPVGVQVRQWSRIPCRAGPYAGQEAGPSVVDAGTAGRPERRYLAEPILQWLADNPTDPVADLEAEVTALPPGPGREGLLGGQL